MRCILLVVLLLFPFCFARSQSQNGFAQKRKDNTHASDKLQHLSAKEISGRNHHHNGGQRYMGKVAGAAISFNNKGCCNIYQNKRNDTVFIEKKFSSGARLPAYDAGELLNQFSGILPYDNPAGHFQLLKQIPDSLSISHFKYQQVYKGVPVYGNEVIVHQYPQKLILNGNFTIIERDIDVTPVLNKAEINRHIIRHYNRNEGVYQDSTGFAFDLLDMQQFQSRLVLYQNKRRAGRVRLAYHVVVRPNTMERWEYFADARTGDILHRFDHTCTIGPATSESKTIDNQVVTLHTYQTDDGYYMIDASRPMFDQSASQLPDQPDGAVITLDGGFNSYSNDFSYSQIKSSANEWNDSVAVSAHDNAGRAYAYFYYNLGRNSIDGDGGNIISFVNVRNQSGEPMDNAFWNGAAIFYGNGNEAFRPLAGALDVAGHELSHGVIQETANLAYQYESGAINESYADIFGAMIDRENWKIGEDIVLDSVYPSGALRNMQNPHNGGSSLNDRGYQPRHMDEQYVGEQDNGGVHINSGIPNYAYYLFANEVSKDTAEKVFYRTLTHYLTRSSGFATLRLSVQQAADDLYGDNEHITDAIGMAFDSVGIAIDSSGREQDTLPENPGEPYLLTYDVNITQNPYRLYSSTPDGQDFVPLSSTSMWSKPSVTDNGQNAVFVGEDHKLYSILLNHDNPREAVIQDETVWDNVAISKNGNKVAAVTTDPDTLIYVYSYDKGQWATFKLYNPTFTKGIQSGGPVYADALEWDYTGEYLVYDAFNSIVNNDGDNIEYWNVGFIKVWDNETNGFGSGKIQKLFPSLPDNVSIGNPSFAKNSPEIIVYDYFNENNETFEIRTINIETREKAVLLENYTLGSPSYSKGDDKIAFSTIDTSSNVQVVASVDLKDDKLQAEGEASYIVNYAKWPVYYAKGDRLTPVHEFDMTANGQVSIYPNPFNNVVNIKGELSEPESVDIQLFDSKGLLIKSKRFRTSDNYFHQKIDLSSLSNGIYMLQISSKNASYSRRIIKK